MQLTRRRALLALSGGALFSSAGRAPGGLSPELLLAHPYPESFPIHRDLQDATNRMVAEMALGYSFEIIPLGFLGSPTEWVAYLYKGALQYALLPTWTLREVGGGLETLGSIGLFEDFSAWADFSAREQSSRIAEVFRERDLDFIGSAWIGPKHVVTSRAIRSLSDFAGLKLVTSFADRDRIAALGAVPLNLDAAEAFSAIQVGLVDGSVGTVPISTITRPDHALNGSLLTTSMGAELTWLVASPELRFAMDGSDYERLRNALRLTLLQLSEQNSRNAKEAIARPEMQTTELTQDERIEMFALLRQAMFAGASSEGQAVLDDLLN